MRKQLAADLFLIGVRKPGKLRNGLFEGSDHLFILTHSAAQVRESGNNYSKAETFWAFKNFP
jgi:hypothetical protein